MLQAVKRKGREIQHVYRDEKALFLESEAGIIRIWPQSEKILRISYTENGKFSETQGEEFADISEGCKWEYAERDDHIRIATDFLVATVDRADGSIRYEDKDGKLFLAEKEKDSKMVEEFDSFRIVINEHTKIEEVLTADGMKSVVRMAEQEFDKKLYHAKISFEFQQGEALYGLGQAQEGVLNLRGTVQYLHQANMKIAVPMMISSRKYGILLSTQGGVIFHDDTSGSYFYTEGEEMLDYFFLAGENLDQVIDGNRKITGKAVMLPKWVFGYLQSRERYETEQDLTDAADAFRERRFGLDALILDWKSWEDDMWGQKSLDRKRFPDPAGMLEKLREQNIHFMMSVWPNMSKETENYREFKERELLLPATEIYDAFSEEGRDLYWEQLKRGLYCHGVRAWWCDSSEPLSPEWNHMEEQEPVHMYQEYVESAAKCMPREKINAYGLCHAKGVYERQRAENDGSRVVNLTRSGCAGSQKYGTVLWSGDISASWETLRKQIAAGLNFCASGLPYWTMDIGGFFVKQGKPWYWNGQYEQGYEDNEYRELYVRWYQFGAFLPVFRSHGTDFNREPWYFGEAGDRFYDALFKINRERYRLMPYIYSLAGSVWRENKIMMRLLAFDFPEDERGFEIKDQYMFGPCLMVCPVTEPMYYKRGAEMPESMGKRTVYLPEGCDWYDYWTKEKYEGGREIIVDAPLDEIPLFVKAGAVIPTVEPVECTDAVRGKQIIFEVYPGADGEFCLYEDDGDGYGYEDGAYCVTTFIWKDKSKEAFRKSEGNTDYREGELTYRIIGSA